MECNKDEAKRALDFAEKKLSKSDYNGAKKLVNKAQNLYPDLDGLKQASKIIDVYIAASNGDGKPDWYGVLGIDPLDNDEIVRTMYKKLLLFVHPDKSRCKDARGAHDLVKKAYSLLSDKAKRIAYDRKRKSKQKKSDSCSASSENSKAAAKEEAQEKMKRWFEESRKKLDAAIAAASARGNPSEAPTTTRGYGYDRKRKWREVKQEQSNACSSSDSTKAPPKEGQERVKRWLEESREKLASAVAAASARGNANEAERIYKKPMKTTGDAMSTSEAQMLFKNPVKSGYGNCSFEAYRLFKMPMTYGK